MAIVQGPNGIRDDELNTPQDPSMPSPLGLDFNNPAVQEALSKMNIQGYDSQVAQPQDPGQNALSRLLTGFQNPVRQPASPAPNLDKPEEAKPQPKEMDFTAKDGEKPYSDQLKDAQGKRDYNNALERMVEGSKKIGAAIAGGNQTQFKPDMSDNEAAIKGNDRFITDLQARKQAEGTDPNSGYSKGLRDWAKQSYGIDLKGASAEQVEKIAPYLSKQFEAQQTRQNQQDLLKQKLQERQWETGERSKDRELRRDELKSASDARAQDKKDASTNKDFGHLSEKLTEEMSSSRSALGKAANISRSADAIEKLATQFEDPNKLDTRHIQEIARNLDAMLSSGAATVSGANKLVPQTASGDWAHIAEYIGNIPQGAEQGAFVQRMLDTVRRERDLAKSQIGVAKKKVIAGYGHLEKADPDRYHGLLKAHGIEDEKDGSAVYSDAQEKGIKAVMDHNKVSRDEAVKALKDAGKL